jgi:hypothetical protein
LSIPLPSFIKDDLARWVCRNAGKISLINEEEGGAAQWRKVNQLTLTKSLGWPLVKVR